MRYVEIEPQLFDNGKVIKDLDCEIEQKRVEFEAAMADIDDRELNINPDVRQLKIKCLELERQIDASKAEYEEQMFKTKNEHASQIEELLLDLDKVEADHCEVVQSLKNELRMKDATISALSKSIVEATSKSSALEQTTASYSSQIKSIEREKAVISEAVKNLEVVIQKTKSEHLKELEDEQKKGRDACDKLESDMIKAAEDQFKKANAEYLRLKREHESSLDRIGKLEKQLLETRLLNEKILQERKTKECESDALVARLKAGTCVCNFRSCCSYEGRCISQHLIVVIFLPSRYCGIAS